MVAAAAILVDVELEVPSYAEASATTFSTRTMTAMAAAPPVSASLETDMARMTLPPVVTEFPPPAHEQNGGPASSSSDGAEDDDDFEDDQADAQSLMQPAISPLATLFTSPKTPAAERMAAFDRMSGGGIFERIEDDQRPGMASLDGTSSHDKLPPPPPSHSSEPMARMAGATEPASSQAPPQQQPPIERMPTPWQAGPKQFHITEPGRWSSMSMAIRSQSSRHKRASSVSENAMLKRLSKALPSISIPSGFMPSIPTPPFFSSHSSSNNTSPQKDERTPKTPQTGGIPDSSSQRSGTPRTSSLRRTTSDDSLLYHTLSRVSSLGDDTRFAHVREQVNVRMKAILDSFEGPSFKMPQMPNLLNTPLVKKSATEPISSSTPNRSGSLSTTTTAPQDPLDKVLETLTGDIVIMGGYRGSILRSAKAPHRRLWVPVKVQLNIRKVKLEVGLDPQDELDMEKSIYADGMLKNIGPVDISKRLFKRLRECENARSGKLRVHDYGYDWRLSPHLLSKRLVKFLEGLPSNRVGTPPSERGAWVISHSLGGIITRHAVNSSPSLFRGVIYVGVPQRCINILGPLRNGDAVLLNEKILTAHVNFSLRTTFVFLPEDGFCFVDKETGEEHRVDFYDVNDWVRYRLCPSVSEAALPAVGKGSNGTFSSLLNLSDSLGSFQPLRSRSNTQTKRDSGVALAGKDRSLAPQMGSSGGDNSPVDSNSQSDKAKNLAYLARTLAEIKQFRAELAHNKAHQQSNAYPPLAVIYAKDIPTTYGCRVSGREGIAHADAYDDLMFRSGDGVVLAKEAMLPEGYEVVKGGRVCTDRGHITMLGDLAGVGRALEAVVRGRQKGIGMGVLEGKGLK
ncbi:hypothetical protein QC762_705920 [Podospora pseudocomata]|uniref:Phosphatidylcholine-sterol O-acyltransferase n=1 Tax=Podospora pseudocomata TaxID=2093779 RepID=A0ABR0G3G9_9PEZI|nr:hypothetical protein QC762_705920 [Podospora pseudocomata]